MVANKLCEFRGRIRGGLFVLGVYYICSRNKLLIYVVYPYCLSKAAKDA